MDKKNLPVLRGRYIYVYYRLNLIAVGDVAVVFYVHLVTQVHFVSLVVFTLRAGVFHLYSFHPVPAVIVVPAFFSVHIAVVVKAIAGIVPFAGSKTGCNEYK
jgi:hypothetical protein